MAPNVNVPDLLPELAQSGVVVMAPSPRSRRQAAPALSADLERVLQYTARDRVGADPLVSNKTARMDCDEPVRRNSESSIGHFETHEPHNIRARAATLPSQFCGGAMDLDRGASLPNGLLVRKSSFDYEEAILLLDEEQQQQQQPQQQQQQPQQQQPQPQQQQPQQHQPHQVTRVATPVWVQQDVVRVGAEMTANCHPGGLLAAHATQFLELSEEPMAMLASGTISWCNDAFRSVAVSVGYGDVQCGLEVLCVRFSQEAVPTVPGAPQSTLLQLQGVQPGSVLCCFKSTIKCVCQEPMQHLWLLASQPLPHSSPNVTKPQDAQLLDPHVRIVPANTRKRGREQVAPAAQNLWRKYGSKTIQVRGSDGVKQTVARQYFKCYTKGCAARLHIDSHPQSGQKLNTTAAGEHNHAIVLESLRVTGGGGEDCEMSVLSRCSSEAVLSRCSSEAFGSEAFDLIRCAGSTTLLQEGNSNVVGGTQLSRQFKSELSDVSEHSEPPSSPLARSNSADRTLRHSCDDILNFECDNLLIDFDSCKNLVDME